MSTMTAYNGFVNGHTVVITKYMGVKPIEINSSLVSAQNRKRLYWTNIPFKGQPKDKGLILKDILEDDSVVDRDKALCIDANYFRGGTLKPYFGKSRRQLVFNRCDQVGEADINGFDILKRVYSCLLYTSPSPRDS